MLVQASELGSDRVIVDCRSFSQYAKGHIPGAVNLDLFAFHWLDTSAAGLAGFARQASQLLSFAGAGGRRVVFYDDSSGMLAARGLWTAMYLSHPDAAMLDGGLGSWKAASLPLETRPNAFDPSPLDARPRPGLIAGYEHVRDSIGRAAIIDARSPAEYEGTTVRAARGGHIPGAVNIDWQRNLGPDGRLLDPEKLRELYGLDPKMPAITYCQGAYRAANSFVALRHAGFEDVRVYLGSWQEWGSRDGLPVERG